MLGNHRWLVAIRLDSAATENKNKTETSVQVKTEKATETVTEVPTETRTETATEAPTESCTEAETEAATEAPTEAATEAPAPAEVSYSPGNVVSLATSKCQAGGMIKTTDNLANLLAQGQITEDEYNEYYPYDGLGYYSVFVETDLNKAATTSGRLLGSEDFFLLRKWNLAHNPMPHPASQGHQLLLLKSHVSHVSYASPQINNNNANEKT